MVLYDSFKRIFLDEYPIFEKGVFERNPDLFEPYFRNIPGHQKKKYQKARQDIPKYEENSKWQSIKGPGFCGAIHPGTGKVFHGAMTGSTNPVYNSDCLYVNPVENLFAISDPPGITEFSRDLITRLDELLETDSIENLELLINEVNRTSGTGLRDRATLSLIHFPPWAPNNAYALLCGDSLLFHGNSFTQEISRFEAEPNRWGTLNAKFELREILINKGDFFILASDGIGAIRSINASYDLDNVLLNHAISDPENFALDITRSCNEIIQQESAGRIRTTFGCGDDLSVLLIEPSNLMPDDSLESYILGGYVEWKPA